MTFLEKLFGKMKKSMPEDIGTKEEPLREAAGRNKELMPEGAVTKEDLGVDLIVGGKEAFHLTRTFSEEQMEKLWRGYNGGADDKWSWFMERGMLFIVRVHWRAEIIYRIEFSGQNGPHKVFVIHPGMKSLQTEKESLNKWLDLRIGPDPAIETAAREADAAQKAEYLNCLADFVRAVEAKEDRAYDLYATLRSGTPKQLARMGHVLIAAQNLNKEGYEPFQYAFTPAGIPLLPVTAKPGLYRTFIRFNLNAWEEEHPLIALSSDILNIEYPHFLIETDHFHRARIVGTAVYKSPSFGWLQEEKKALLIRLGEGPEMEGQALEQFAESFHLREEEYLGESTAFMAEHGEKEYSLEIAGIRDGRMEVLWRYTIGGNDKVSSVFEPELISMDLKE